MNFLKNKDIKKFKKEYEYSYTLGVFPTLELIEKKKEQIIKIFISSKGIENEGIRKIEKIAKESKILIEENDKMINRLSNKNNTYAIGVFKKYRSKLEKDNHIVLVNPSDMGNFGTIARTALGFNIKNIAIISPGMDIFDPRAIRASMGAIFKLNIEYFKTFSEYNNRFQENEKYSFILDSELYLDQLERVENKFSLIFGNESSGLDEEYFKKISKGIKIRQSEEIDSLNLAISVGIAIYEFTKTI